MEKLTSENTEYYDEGDDCPSCKKGMLVVSQCMETGETTLKCQDCFYDATDDEK